MSGPGPSDVIPFGIDERMEWFVNNQRLADVKFIVGDDKETIFAHKFVLASASPAFERCFYSGHNLQMNGKEPIVVPDLSSVGFLNMIKFIYTNKLGGLELSQMGETFAAGDKYQVYDMNRKIVETMKNVLNTSNCCTVYDQLRNFAHLYPPAQTLIDQVQLMIRYEATMAFKKPNFVSISLEALVDLLMMDALAVDEMDVLQSCTSWVDEEIRRLNLIPNAANKSDIFKPIKTLIRFSKIALNQLRHFGPLKDLLSNDELNSLFLHHGNPAEFVIKCETTRKTLTYDIVYSEKFTTNDPIDEQFSSFSTKFRATGDIVIDNIFTFLPVNVRDLELSIKDNSNGAQLNLRCDITLDVTMCWQIKFCEPLKIDAGREYNFLFKFRRSTISNKNLSCDSQMKFRYPDTSNSLICYLSSVVDSFHCIRQIDLYKLS